MGRGLCLHQFRHQKERASHYNRCHLTSEQRKVLAKQKRVADAARQRKYRAGWTDSARNALNAERRELYKEEVEAQGRTVREYIKELTAEQLAEIKAEAANCTWGNKHE